MNYKELVDRIRQVVFDHKMLVDFGYGQISDIKVRSEGEGEESGADYPYCFLNPQPHVRTQTEITYNFNMIVMDMAREEEGDEYQNFLAIQSDCMQYIDDIIARLYYHYTDKPEVSFDLNYTPFYERFQDDLAGATANLSITVPTNINDCITPYKPGPILINAYEGSALPFSANGYIQANEVIDDPEGIWSQYGQGEIANFAAYQDRPNPLPTVWEGQCTIKVLQAPTQEEWNEFRDWRLNVGLSQNNPVCVVEGLSVTPPQVDDVITFNVSIEYTVTSGISAGLQLRDAFPGEPWATLFEQVNSQIKVYTVDYGL